MMVAALSSIALLALIACGCGNGKTLPSEAATGEISPSLTLITEGAFPKFSPDGGLIAFTLERTDPSDPNGVAYDVCTIRPDGTGLTCLTRGKPALAGTRWRGQPFWHPSGDYIVFTAENAAYPRKGVGTTARPGLGRNHDVWIMTSDGERFWRITEYPDNWGVIRPSFSRDGKVLYWNEEYSMEKYPQGLPDDPDDDTRAPGHQGHPGSYWGLESFRYRRGEELGAWRMRLADISFENGEPRISNLRSVEPPDGFTLIEGAGLTTSGDGLICSCAYLEENGGQGLWGDICVWDMDGNIIQRLTDTPFAHDENPEYSPGGERIVWNASRGDPGEGEELWIMDADGGSKVRLTYFGDPGHEEFDAEARQITELSWSPDGKSVVFGHVSAPKRAGVRLHSVLYLLNMESSPTLPPHVMGKQSPRRLGTGITPPPPARDKDDRTRASCHAVPLG